MALSAQLGEAGLVPEKLETTATMTFEKIDAAWTVTQIDLAVKGRVPKADVAAWEKAANGAKVGVQSRACSIQASQWTRNWKANCISRG
jgi:lipoyl-dependent peroxiredoxin